MFGIGPLTYVGFAGCLALGALAGIQTIKANHAEGQRNYERAAYAERVIQAESAAAAAETKYRQRERDMEAEVQVLAAQLDQASDELLVARKRADTAAQRLRDADISYVAAQAGRAASNSTSAQSVNAGTIAMLGELHFESDRFAQFAAGEADRLAAQLMLLQHYVRDECHN